MKNPIVNVHFFWDLDHILFIFAFKRTANYLKILESCYVFGRILIDFGFLLHFHFWYMNLVAYFGVVGRMCSLIDQEVLDLVCTYLKK